jgi:hypothetical protein
MYRTANIAGSTCAQGILVFNKETLATVIMLVVMVEGNIIADPYCLQAVGVVAVFNDTSYFVLGNCKPFAVIIIRRGGATSNSS